MQPIKDTKLEDLVQEANTELLRVAREGGVAQIRKLFMAVRQLSGDVMKMEKDLTKKREQLKKKEDEVAKLQSGDWSVLRDEEDKSQNNEE